MGVEGLDEDVPVPEDLSGGNPGVGLDLLNGFR